MEAVRNRLAGAFQKPVIVKRHPMREGVILAFVPMAAITSSGLHVCESAISGVQPVISGNAAAITSAERWVARRAGDGWSATLDSFDAPTRRGVFALEKASGD